MNKEAGFSLLLETTQGTIEVLRSLKPKFKGKDAEMIDETIRANKQAGEVIVKMNLLNNEY